MCGNKASGTLSKGGGVGDLTKYRPFPVSAGTSGGCSSRCRHLESGRKGPYHKAALAAFPKHPPKHLCSLSSNMTLIFPEMRDDGDLSDSDED